MRNQIFDFDNTHTLLVPRSYEVYVYIYFVYRMYIGLAKNLPRAADDGLNLLSEWQIVPRLLQHPAVPREPPLLRVVHGAVHPLQPPSEVLAVTDGITDGRAERFAKRNGGGGAGRGRADGKKIRGVGEHTPKRMKRINPRA